MKKTSQGDRISHYTWDASFQYCFDRERLLANVKELTRHLRGKKLFRTGDYIQAVIFTNHPDEHAFSEVVEGKLLGLPLDAISPRCFESLLKS